MLCIQATLGARERATANWEQFPACSSRLPASIFKRNPDGGVRVNLSEYAYGDIAGAFSQIKTCSCVGSAKAKNAV